MGLITTSLFAYDGPDMGIARKGAGSFVRDGKIYVLGGWNEDSHGLRKWSIFDLKMAKWIPGTENLRDYIRRRFLESPLDGMVMAMVQSSPDIVYIIEESGVRSV